MRSKLIAGIALALVVPSVALAAKPPAPGKSTTAPSNAAPTVMYVLHGTLGSYTPASGGTNGSIYIVVSSANYHGAALKGQTLLISVSSSTNVALFDGSTATNGHQGIVKVRGPLNVAPTGVASALMNAPRMAFQIIDRGPSA